MKKNLFFILALIATQLLFAQSERKSGTVIRQETKTMSQGVKNALVIEIPNAQPKEVEDRWKEFMETYKSKPKWNKKEKEYFSDNAQIAEVNGNNPVDVYARIEESGTSSTLLTVWMDLGGAFLNSDEHKDKYSFADKMVMTFAKDVAIAASQKQLEEEEKKFKKIESKLKSLVKDKEDLLKDIENYKAKIKKAEEDLIKNDGNQKEQQRNLEDQKNSVKKAQQKLEEVSKA